MTVEVTNRSGELVPSEQVLALLQYAIVRMDLHPECELNFVFIDEKEMTELHIKWMNLPGPTDVLSFPMDMPEGPNDPALLGDIVISPTIAAAQALVAGHSTSHEIFILAVHGLLHILGYDHEELADELVMFALQEELVAKWGDEK